MGVTGKTADEVLAAYEATYGASPTSPYWGHAYDATTLLLHSIEAVAVGPRTGSYWWTAPRYANN